MKRALSLILAISMLLPALIACSSESKKKPADSNETTKSQETTVSTIYYEPDELPELDFDGETVVFCLETGEIMGGELFAEELTSDVVNDSIYNRERFVEDRLNVNLENLDPKGFSLEKMIMSDDNDVQVYGQANYGLTEFIFSGYLLDLYELDYLDFDKPWWPEYFTDAAELDGSLYVAGGSISRSLLRNMFGVYYNKAIVENYGESNAEFLDLYGLVDRGEWTIDKMTELCGGIYQDLNGNSERDQEDLYGICYGGGIGVDNMWSCFDINVLSKTADGWYEADVNTDKLYTAVDKMQNLLHNTVGCFVPENDDDGVFYSEIPEKFASDSAMFMVNKLYAAEIDIIRNMKNDYGLLPFPKFDEAQKEYYTHAHDHYQTLAIPSTNPTPNVAAAVLEAMASYSYRHTVPAYLDTALKGKYMSDPESRKMVDLIVNGLKLDTCWIYVYTLGAAFANEFRDVVTFNEGTASSVASNGLNSLKRDLKTYKKLYEVVKNG